MNFTVLKRLEELKGNEILASDLLTLDYQKILPEGAVLKKEYIGKLFELGIVEVLVKDEEEKYRRKEALKERVNNTVKEKVKKILEHHTYQNSKELAELSNTADSIIKIILEEDKIIEQIYDIQERNADIYEHSITICSFAIMVSLKLGLDKRLIHDIGVGCLLHDIGLRYTTIDFTFKDVKSLNPQEMIEYKKHPVYGYSAIRSESWISDVSKNIILQHHERMDGSGFPLKTRKLPIECKIVNVCDAFDEMICGIWQKRVKVYEAVEYLKNYRNIKYDAKIVDTFLSFVAVYPAGSHVVTSEGELAMVLRQNKDFQDRPIIRIVKDKDGNFLQEEKILDLVKVHNVFIDNDKTNEL